ncbi:catalase [Dysgonomonas sp. Marseille-P4677]|uniref:catalase n=1 Tax=Dysgonomonas sp. Marseille-P4677 TaxID=2364790 RepID=UPI00191262CE|nr:catalase [Dysgonomonas sp. Marseille-P4677]MBK5721343.1 catalase [Dysgonomonas sp. Marseille-P4677]
MEKNKKILTTNQGNPVDNDQASITTQNPTMTLLSDVHTVEKLAHFDRERIPERVVHAKGSGAFGYFEVTHDVTKYTCADFLSQVGKRTDMLARFSTVGGEKGSADTARDPRGFALKLYTDQGNYDMVGNNTPTFFIRDGIKFPDFIHTQKRNPLSNLKDADAFWDFLSLTPESIHQVTILFSDRGTPDGYRHMHGFSSHTYMWYNAKGEHFWIKWHFKTNQGIKNLTDKEATELAGTDPDYATRDLYNSIEKGDFPSWTAYVQIMKPEEADNYKFDAFDITKVWYQGDYPLIPVGKFVLNRNPQNYFNEIEQAAFSPSNFVPGIASSPDKMLQIRLFSYPDTHRHRLGANFDQLPVNAPKCPMHNYQRDGYMNIGNQAAPNYYPNSFNGATPDAKFTPPSINVQGIAARHEYPLGDIDYVQAGELYSRVMSDYDRNNLISNIVGHIKNAQQRIQYRQTAIFYKAHPEYGTRVAEGLGLDVSRVKELANMSQEERVKATAN